MVTGSTSPELRRRLKKHYKEVDRYSCEWEKEDERRYQLLINEGQRLPDMKWNPPPFPKECRNMICGAKTRPGHPCKRRDLFTNGRCKFHGGASTGPISKEGKRRSALNGMRPKVKRSP